MVFYTWSALRYVGVLCLNCETWSCMYLCMKSVL